jgi:ankyrin repeat protein
MMPNKPNHFNSAQITSILGHLMGDADGAAADQAAAELAFDQLTLAAQAGDTQLFQQLVLAERSQDRQINQPTMLIGAVMAQRLPVARALIQAGANVNATYQEFFTFDALECAVSNDSIEMVQLLLEAGADPNLHNGSPALSPIRKACEKGNAKIVRALLDAGAAVKFGTGFRLLTDAVEKSTPEIVQLLIDAGCNVNTRDQDTPLTAACRLAKAEIVPVLLANGANPNKPGMHNMMPLTTVFLAPKMVDALAPWGLAETTHDLNSSMEQIVLALLKAGADPNTHDVMGHTPLMLALEREMFRSAKALIEAGADVNRLTHPQQDSVFIQGREIVQKSAWQLAIERNHQSAVDFLTALGVSE